MRRGSPASTRTPANRKDGYATDERAVRFVEVTVNGPKSWSLAAELHPDIAAAYEAAQDRAAAQVIGWLGQHATARVGPRGQQVAVPVERLEAVTVRHYTSRAGDPHRHLHLQINARVWAAGAWRGTGHGRVARLDRRGQRHRARRRAHRPGVPGRARRPRVLADRIGGDQPARPVRRGVLQARRADRPQHQTLREGLACRASRPGARPGAAPVVGRAGVGRRPPRQSRPGLRAGAA